MMNTIKIMISVLWLFVGISSASAVCGAPSFLNTEPTGIYRGRYENGWGYEVYIPKGYRGTSYQDPDAPQHGLWVVLSPVTNIIFHGVTNSAIQDWTDDEPYDSIDYSIWNLLRIHRTATEIKSYEMHQSKLGNYKGTKYIVKYTCPGSSDIFIQETIIAIGPEKEPVQDITLTTTQKRYKQDRRIFDRIVSSWRQIPRE